MSLFNERRFTFRLKGDNPRYRRKNGHLEKYRKDHVTKPNLVNFVASVKMDWLRPNAPEEILRN